MNIHRMVCIGIVLVTLGVFTPQVLAAGWCPNSSDNVIYCSNCSRELTCHVYTPLYIVGDNVTLDGEGYGIWDASETGLTVFGKNAYIADLEVLSPGFYEYDPKNGIVFDQESSSWSTLYYVMVNGATGEGMVNEGSGAVTITESSKFLNNGNRGVVADGAIYGAYTDFHDSWAWYNENASGYYTEKPNSYITESFLVGNSVGLFGVADDLLIDSCEFSSNGYGLLLASGDNNSVTDNTGFDNTIVDCYQSGLTNLYHDNNSWETYEGNTCPD